LDKPNFNDVAQFLIAIVMIVGFIYLTNMLILPATPSTDLVELLAAVFGGWIGAIIGFYFGQRPVRTLTESVEEKSRDIGARQQSIIALSTKVAELTKLLEEEPA
jgi:uncharacterized membrane protein